MYVFSRALLVVEDRVWGTMPRSAGVRCKFGAEVRGGENLEHLRCAVKRRLLVAPIAPGQNRYDGVKRELSP